MTTTFHTWNYLYDLAQMVYWVNSALLLSTNNIIRTDNCRMFRKTNWLNRCICDVLTPLEAVSYLFSTFSFAFNSCLNKLMKWITLNELPFSSKTKNHVLLTWVECLSKCTAFLIQMRWVSKGKQNIEMRWIHGRSMKSVEKRLARNVRLNLHQYSCAIHTEAGL